MDPVSPLAFPLTRSSHPLLHCDLDRVSVGFISILKDCPFQQNGGDSWDGGYGIALGFSLNSINSTADGIRGSSSCSADVRWKDSTRRADSISPLDSPFTSSRQPVRLAIGNGRNSLAVKTRSHCCLGPHQR